MSVLVGTLWLVLHAFAAATLAHSDLRPVLDTSMVMHDVVPFIGLLDLPKITARTAPPECAEKPEDVCQLERDGNYTAVFAAYEERFSRCNTLGWKKLGHVGAGHNSAVALRTTPCGMSVVMKATHQPRLIEHIKHDCAVLEQLMASQLDPFCRNCFPKYYYYSNLTGICYAEHIAAVPIDVFLNHINSQSRAGFATIRRTFLDGLKILAVLERVGIQHRDLTFRNILIRIPPKGSREYRVVLLDFGGSKSREVGFIKGVGFDQLGNCGYNDIRSYAFSFFNYYYPGIFKCNVPIEDLTPVGDAGTFQRYLWEVLIANRAIRDRENPIDYNFYIRKFELEVKRL